MQPSRWRVARTLQVSRLQILAIVALIFSFPFISTEPASAHAQLVATFPQDGSTVQSSPSVIVLSWGEDIKTSKNQFTLISASGKKFPTEFSYRYDEATREGTVKLSPQIKLGKAGYILSWKVVSRDGHLVAGAFTFGVQTKAATGVSGPRPSLIDEVIQAIFWIFLILAFGAALASRRRAFKALAIGIIASSALRLLRSYTELHQTFSQIGSSKVSLIAIIIFGLILLTFRLPETFNLSDKVPELLILTTITFVSQAFFEGHALDLEGHSYLKYASAAHLLFALLWTGAACALFFRRTPAQYALTRRISTASIFLMLIAGSILTFILARPLRYADRNAWLTFLFVKGAFIALAFGLGIFHHFAGKYLEDSDSFTMKRTLLVEVTSVVGILIATSFMVSYTPPKVTEGQLSLAQTLARGGSTGGYAQFTTLFDDGEKGILYLQKTSPGQPSMMMLGINSSKVHATKTVDVYLTNKALGVVDLHVTLVGGANQYMSYTTLPGAGKWHVTVQVMIDEFTQAQSSLDVNI